MLDVWIYAQALRGELGEAAQMLAKQIERLYKQAIEMRTGGPDAR